MNEAFSREPDSDDEDDSILDPEVGPPVPFKNCITTAGYKRLDVANAGREHDCVRFGATVTVADEEWNERTLSIVGIDELDPVNGRVSWISPIARALMKAGVGDVVTLKPPGGAEQLEVVIIIRRVAKDVALVPPSQGDVVGGEVVQAPTSGRATEDIPIGVRLEVTPAISAASRVRLRIRAKSSSLGAPLPPDDIFEELSRMVDAEILEANGEPAVLGGLSREAGTDNSAGVPGLRRVPSSAIFSARRRWPTSRKNCSSSSRRGCWIEAAAMRTARYFEDSRRRRDRIVICDAWIRRVIAHPEAVEILSDGRIRLWATIVEVDRVLRVVLLEDGETVHNAFFDRSYRRVAQ